LKKAPVCEPGKRREKLQGRRGFAFSPASCGIAGKAFPLPSRRSFFGGDHRKQPGRSGQNSRELRIKAFPGPVIYVAVGAGAKDI